MPEQPHHHRPNQHGLLRRLGRRVFSARRRRHAIFFIALAAGMTVFLPALVIVPPFAVVLGAIALFVVYLTLVGIALPALDAEFLRAKAAEADAPVGFIFAVVVAVVAICCVSLFKALNGEGTPAAIEIGLSIVSVLLHSTFAYFFNTLIVAATVNVAVAVGS